MKSFNIPNKLNGAQLIDELLAIDIKLPYDPIAHKNKMPPIIDAELLWLDIADSDETKAAEVIANHIGVDSVVTLSIEDKLASVGLSVTDLKDVLGL
jgi:hypothetical protein